MGKINLEICCGTTCYILGASKLMNVDDYISEDLRSMVEVSAVPCMNLCNSENLGGAPYVKINGRIVSQAKAEEVAKVIRELAQSEVNE